MRRYESARAASGLAVRVGPHGIPARVRLSAAAAGVPALELANQIMWLHTLAHLRRDLAAGLAGAVGAEGFAPTAAQVEAFAQMIDF